MSRSKFGLFMALGVAAMLAVLAGLPAMAAVGVIETNKDFVSPTGTVEVTVTDSDLNVLTPATTTVNGTWGSVGTVVFFSLPDTTGTQTGTGVFGTGAAEGDEIAGTPVITPANPDFVVNVAQASTGRISIQYVGGSAPGGATLSLDYNLATINEAEVTVKSPSDTTGITVTLNETDEDGDPSANTGIFKGTFTVGPGNSSDTIDQIQAVAGQQVDITYSDLHNSATTNRSTSVTIESTKPTGVLVGPPHESFTTDLTPTLTVDFTDLDSGVDAGTFEFVLEDITGGGSYADGATIAADTTEITNGFRGTVTLDGTYLDGNTYLIEWYAKTTDEAGNEGRTDADPSTAGDQPFVLIIDRQGPNFSAADAFVGRHWDAGEEEVVTDADEASNTTIAILFPDILTGEGEQLEATSFATSDFEIDGLKLVGGASVSDIAPDAVNVFAGAPNYVFLTVPAMAPDADPTAIILKSSIADKAGNTTSTGTLSGTDILNRISPTLTATLNKALDDEEVEITVTSNEALTGGAPTIYVNRNNTGSSVVVPTLVGTLMWRATLNPADGVYAVEVEGTDTATNPTSIGNELDTEDFPTDDSIVFYIDNTIAAATVTPANNATPTTQNPFFLIIDHSDEGAEYGLLADATMTSDSGLVVTDLDVHETVELTAATLDGVDILDLFESQDDLSFTAAITNIGIGEHVLVFSSVDEAGNENENQSVTFTVKARGAYSIPMSAGWNLVSFPGSPVDTDIDDVLPSSHPATDVLAYDDGVWMVATRSSGGSWEGTLSMVDGQHGYWVNTTSSTPIKALLHETAAGSAATLPSIPIEQGWNLVSVMNLQQDAAGTTRLAGDYFVSIDWSAAFTYNAATRVWTRVTASAGNVATGQAVWVWANEDGTLVP